MILTLSLFLIATCLHHAIYDVKGYPGIPLNLVQKDTDSSVRFVLTATKEGDYAVLKGYVQAEAQNTKTLNRVQGISLSFALRNMICEAPEADSNCITNEDIEKKSSDFNSRALTAGAHTLLISFKKNSAKCGISIMEPFASNLEECEALNWQNANNRKSDFAAKAGQTNDVPSADDVILSDISNEEKSRQNKYNSMRTFFTLKIKDGVIPNYSFGLEDGSLNYISWGLWEIDTKKENNNNCNHQDIFGAASGPSVLAARPFTNTQDQAWKIGFTASAAPTQAPTQAPTPPTKAPTTKEPTKEPTKKPTKPTKEPTKEPTKKPTTPTNEPTKKPTRPTKQPTMVPTYKPEPLPCPELNNWLYCNKITKETKCNSKSRRAERKCHWCDSAVDGTKCRPTQGLYSEVTREMPINEVCGEEDPFQMPRCEKFPECPPQEEMINCRLVNKSTLKGNKKKKVCQGGGKIEVKLDNGDRKTVKIPRRRCAFANSICRAVGNYYKFKDYITSIPGYFDKHKGCPAWEE